jgi:hypothetical protein
MATQWSEKIREIAEADYVRPARRKGGTIRIVLGDFKKKLESQGFPPAHPNQICTALESKKFWQQRGLRMRTPLGQARRNETTFEFDFLEPTLSDGSATQSAKDPLLELMGILKDAIREGADAFVQELRRDKDSLR